MGKGKWGQTTLSARGQKAWSVPGSRIAYPKRKYVRRFQQRFMDLFQQEVDRVGKAHGLWRVSRTPGAEK